MILLPILIIYLVYTTCMLMLWYGWNIKDAPNSDPSIEIHRMTTVLVPVRNESNNIGALLFDLQKQNFPSHKFEVIVIDDNSSDNTVEIVNEVAEYAKIEIKVLALGQVEDASVSHKKKALTMGVKNAKGSLILCTDGDCRVGRNWISTITNFINLKNCQFVSGPVVFDPAFSFWKHLQKLEFLTLIGVGAASLKLGYPTMCNGANMAFTKQSFLEINGYAGFENVHSGDDEFLMYKIARNFPDQLAFIRSGEALVKTEAKHSWKAFINQRKRWAGKWKYHRAWRNRGLAVLVFLVNSLMLVLVILGLFKLISPMEISAFFLIKIFSDVLFVRSVVKGLSQRFSFFHFLCIEFLYPVYTIYFGLVSNLGSYEWKGRKLKNKTP